MPYFELIGADPKLQSGHTAKYWEITQVGKKTIIRFGKIGTDGQLSIKEFDSKAEAEAFVAKKIKEKTKEGYVKDDFVVDDDECDEDYETEESVAPDDSEEEVVVKPAKKKPAAKKAAPKAKKSKVIENIFVNVNETSYLNCEDELSEDEYV